MICSQSCQAEGAYKIPLRRKFTSSFLSKSCNGLPTGPALVKSKAPTVSSWSGAPMRWREFISLLGGAAAWPFAARAQQAGKVPSIGFLGANPSIESYRVAAFVQRLRELAWIDGRNLAIEYRWAEGSTERFVEITTEFVRRKVDVIVTVT